MSVIRIRVLPTTSNDDVELCEHKGIGHPDSLCDGVAEAVSRALCRGYLDACGSIQHYNVDKALLIGGSSAPRFGGGTILEPWQMILGGRASPIPGRDLQALIHDAAFDYLATVAGCERGSYRFESRVRAGSAQLRRVLGGAVRANDTSFGCGYAPPSRLERIVLDAAAVLRDSAVRQEIPALGLDFKLMGRRNGESIALTVACALRDRYLSSAQEYFAAKGAIVERLHDEIGGAVEIAINALDDSHAGDASGLYLTVTGLSAEHGDDGQVGRGNRVNGLITPHRSMSLEAAAGKNAAAHVGKLYNLAAFEIADAIVRQLPAVRSAEVQLLAQIGDPIERPILASITLHAAEIARGDLERAAMPLVRDGLAAIPQLTERLVAGDIAVF